MNVPAPLPIRSWPVLSPAAPVYARDARIARSISAAERFAFCDTDSLATRAAKAPKVYPSLPENGIDEIIERFDALQPVRSGKDQASAQAGVSPMRPDLRCLCRFGQTLFLYRWRPGKRIQIVKASESALGAIIGRTRN